MNSAEDPFGKATLLAWLPGETLFSLISRHQYFLGHTLSARTCEQFFGHPRAGSQHDLPSRLSYFVTRTGGCFGNVEKVAKEHTLLAYYAAFITAEELVNAIACMAGDSVAHLKLRLGILTSRFRANHPLKACATCMVEDDTAFGWAYWHVDHQSPGVWICQKHGQPLRESTLKATGVERFQWHLPSDFSNRCIVDLSAPGLECQLCCGQLRHVYFRFGHKRASDDGPVYGTRNVHIGKSRRYKTQSLWSMV